MTLELRDIRLPLPVFELKASLTIGDGITGLSGPSGSGKTSLLEIIAGLRRPASGTVILDGAVLTEGSRRGSQVPPWRRNMGYVPQDQALFPHWNVNRNLMAAVRFRREPVDPDLFSRITGLLELEPLLDRTTMHLSGGEKARVALGRALMGRPSLLLLDEPLAHLDDRLRLRTLEYLKSAAAEFHLPMLLVSHSAWELRAVCGEILHMERGIPQTAEKPDY